MKIFAVLVFLVSWQANSWANTPTVEQILKANEGDKGGHYLGAEAACTLSIFLPGQFVRNDTNYWIQSDFQVTTEAVSYPDAAASGGFGWEVARDSIKFYADSSKKNPREFQFDPATLKFISFSMTDGIQGITCLLN